MTTETPIEPTAFPHARWRKAVYRVVNVSVGCVQNWERSRVSRYCRGQRSKSSSAKMERQIQLAGEASQAVMRSAADRFSSNALCHFYDHNDDDETVPFRIGPNCAPVCFLHNVHGEMHPGVVLTAKTEETKPCVKHEAAIQESRLVKSQLGVLKYDPFHMTTPDRLVRAFSAEVSNTLALALRIQHTVVLLDGIVRNDPKHDFDEFHIQLFAGVGSLIHDMLALPSNDDDDKDRRKQQSYEQLKKKLGQIRSCIIELSLVVAQSSSEIPSQQLGKLGVGIIGSRHNLASLFLDNSVHGIDDLENGFVAKTVTEEDEDPDITEVDEDDQGRRAPKFVHGSRVCALLFLQLVEHLALRSVRLYQSWKHCEFLLHAAERQEIHSSCRKK